MFVYVANVHILLLQTLPDAGNVDLVGTIDVSELGAISSLRNEHGGLVVLFKDTAERATEQLFPQLNLG